MAKGQQKSNREVRKPKAATNKKSRAPGPSPVASVFAKPAKDAGKIKKG